MNAELREKLIERVEAAIKWAGAPSWDEGMTQAKKVVMFTLEGIEEIQTKEQVRRIIDAWPEPSYPKARLLLATARALPTLISFAARHMAQRLEEDAPIPKGGRPPIPQQIRAEVVTFISELNKRGASLTRCKKRAADRFGFSKSTVERMWLERSEIGEVDFLSVRKFVLDSLEEDTTPDTRVPNERNSRADYLNP